MDSEQSDQQGVIKLLTKKMEHIDLINTNIHETGEQQPPVLVGSLQNAEQVEKKQFFISDQLLKINSIKRIQDPSKNPSYFKDCQYHCQLCNMFLAEMKSIKGHTRTDGHIERLEQKITDIVVRTIPEVTAAQLSSMTILVEELYSNYSAIAKGQSDIRKGIVEDLGGMVNPLYKDVSVEMFGSSRMSCALTTSDINLNINIEDTEISQNDIPKIFLQVLEMLRTQDKAKYRKIQEDFYSRIPRIVFQHWQSKLWCELRIGSYAPTQVASLIDLYCRIDPRVSKLCVAMKYWAKVLRVSTYINGHYPSVVFVLMVLHYLQQTTPPVIPVLHEQVSQKIEKSVNSNEEAEFEPEYSQLSAASQQWQSTNTQSLGELLHGLLRYYVLEFDQRTLAVTIRQSKPLYRQYRDWGSTKLAVEDPFLIKNNISKAAGSEKVYEYLLNSFKLTYLHMLQVNKKITKLVRDIVEGRIEELPAVDEDGDEDRDEDNSDEHEEEAGQGAESTPQNQCDTDDENIDGDKGAGQGVNPKAGQGVNPSKSSQVIDNEETTNTEVIVDVTEVRNVTEEILKEMSVKAVGKKTAKKRRYHAQIMKAIDGIVLSEEDTSGNYVFEEKDFKMLLKSYPEACLLCRRARHTAKSCPDEVVPKFNGNIKWPPLNSIESLSGALQNYTEEVMLRPNEETERKKIRTRILQDIHILYPKASLELFGSSANQFGHCNSDLDLCLLMNEKYDCEKVEIIEKLAKHFKKDSFYRGVSWIPSARVPIIKLSIDKWKIDCDISMENCLALQNTRMLSAYASIDTRVRPLGYTLKRFAKVCDMCDASSGSISSYGYILMLIHFLQQLHILPILQKLPRHKTPSGPIIEGWDCYYFTQLHNLSNMWRPENTSLLPAELWLHFVLYFSREFDWKHNVVTIRQREPLSKFEKSWSSKPMAIEDPFNHDHNLAQAVSSRMRTYILRRFQKAVLHHQKPEIWKDIDHVMNYGILCGDYKAPKFIICEKCGRRNHRRADCPRNKDQTDGATVTEQNILQADEKKNTDKNGKRKTNGSDSVTDVDVLRDRRNGNEPKRNGIEPKQNERENESNAKGDSIRDQSSFNYDSLAGKSRSQIRQILQDQTGGSIEQLKKLQTQMKARAHSSKGTSMDKKALSVLSDLIKKLQKESRDHVHVQSEATEDVSRNDIKQTPPINEPSTRMSPSSRQSHKHRREHVSVKVLENKSRVPMDNHHRQARSGPTVIVRPKMETVTSLYHPPSDAVPHGSYHVGNQHQMEMPRPHMPVPLLPSPTTVYNQSPPTRFFTEPTRHHPLINQPPLIPGSCPPSNVPLRSPSLLPNPPPQRWPPQTSHPQWYPPPRGYN